LSTLRVPQPRTIAPRPVYCVIDHERRNRDIAEAVCAGRFEHFGLVLELGQEPDWTGAALPQDEEWRIAWSKFYEGLDLAHAFGQTGDPRFLLAWEGLVASWIRQVPVGWDATDVAARRVQNWIYAWRRFAAAPAFRGLSAGLEEKLVRSIAAQADYVRAELTPVRNHRTLELYTLFLVPLAFPDVDPGGHLLRLAMDGLHENLLAEVLPDGVHCERSTHYHLLVLRSFLGARENARRFGLRFPDGFDEHLERACEFALHCHRPDGSIPALSDSDTGSYRELLELAASLLGRPDFLYAASGGIRGTPPRRRNVSFPDGGYFFQRSGWGTGSTPFSSERFLVFDCGPLGEGGHGHYDLLSFEAAAGGHPFVVDPGRYTYAETGLTRNWRHWFKGTAAHNTVCVDGLDQTPYRRRRPKGPVAEGRLLERLTVPGLDVLRGEARSPCYDAAHTRRIVFVADEYWLVEDRLHGDRSHRFDLRFHLAPEAWGSTEAIVDGDRAIVRAPGLALVFAGKREPVLEEGWYAPEYGVKLRAPVVSVVDRARSVTFTTLVAPLAADEPVPGLAVHSAEGVVVVEVTRPGCRDLVAWADSVQRLDLGPHSVRARTAWLRLADDGDPLAFRACGEEES
jgi:Heparinase II/III-like protein/Heparinase II/III N-terminus